LQNAALLGRALIIKLTLKRDGGVRKGRGEEIAKREIGDGGLEGNCFSLAQETIRFQSITCSCIVALREAVTLSRSFFLLGFLVDFLHISVRGAGGGAQRPRLGLNEPKKKGRSTTSGLYFSTYFFVYTLDKKCCSVGFYMLYNVQIVQLYINFPVIKLNWSALWCSVNIIS
jgi:hypothetical protein